GVQCVREASLATPHYVPGVHVQPVEESGSDAARSLQYVLTCSGSSLPCRSPFWGLLSPAAALAMAGRLAMVAEPRAALALRWVTRGRVTEALRHQVTRGTRTRG